MVLENNVNQYKVKKKPKSKLALMLGILTLLLLSEVFSGIIRYYCALASLTPLIYLPKVLALGLVVVEYFDVSKYNILVVTFIIVYIVTGVIFGSGIDNLIFTLFMFTPLIFGLAFGKYLLVYEMQMQKIVLLCFGLCVIGIIMDFTVELPWKGFAYKVGDFKVEGNRQWSTMGIDRLTGFARISNSLASMVALFSLYMLFSFENKAYKFLLIAVTVTSLFLTTSKVTLVAYVFTLLYSFFIRNNSIKKTICTIILLFGCLLPVISIIYKFNMSNSLNNDFKIMILGSFDDRLVNTWPGVFDILVRNNALLTGTGFGTVGASVSNYPIKELKGVILKDLSYIDCTPLFLYSIFGVLGIVMYLYNIRIFSKLLQFRSSIFKSMELVMLCSLMLGLTSDVFLDPIPALLLGICISISIIVIKYETRKTRL